MEWHVFSSRSAPRLEGHAAITAFETKQEQRLIISAHLANGPTIKCTFAIVPEYIALRNAWSNDLYVMSAAMEWTLVLTHEEGFGPYFVEQPSVDMQRDPA
jgi:hypothetical protein